MNAPCMNCKIRFVGCHADCMDYKLFQKELKQHKRNVAAESVGKRTHGKHEMVYAEFKGGRIKIR